VPLEIYFNDRGIAKVKIAVVKGRKKYEKKQYLIQKQLEREKERELRDYLRRKG
ncbi:MAG: SsrA-binding protein, partial [Thermoplasmata archaeon]